MIRVKQTKCPMYTRLAAEEKISKPPCSANIIDPLPLFSHGMSPCFPMDSPCSEKWRKKRSGSAWCSFRSYVSLSAPRIVRKAFCFVSSFTSGLAFVFDSFIFFIKVVHLVTAVFCCFLSRKGINFYTLAVHPFCNSFVSNVSIIHNPLSISQGVDSHMKQTGMLVGNFEFNP